MTAVSAAMRLLGVDETAAACIVERAGEAARKMPATFRAQRWRRMGRDVDISLRNDAESGVIALPFARRQLLWLAAWSRQLRKPVHLLATDLTAPFLRRNARSFGPHALLTTLDLVRLPPATPGFFVTFPDQTVGSGRTSVQVPMAAQPWLFQVLESLLLRKQATELYCWRDEGLERWEAPAENGPSSIESAMVAETAWLAASVERAIRADPEGYFGWNTLLRKCPKQRIGVESVSLDVLKGFLRVWARTVQGPQAQFGELMALIDAEGRALLEGTAAAGLRLGTEPE